MKGSDKTEELEGLLEELYAGDDGSNVNEEHSKGTSDANGVDKPLPEDRPLLMDNGLPELKKLRDIHYEIIRRASLGYKMTEISKELNIAYITVWKTLQTPLAKERLEIIRGARDASAGEVMNQFKSLSPIALEVYKEAILDGNISMKDRIKAAGEVLDRAGHTAVQKNLHLHGELTQDDIDNIKQRAASQGIVANEVEDAQVTEDESEKK